MNKRKGETGQDSFSTWEAFPILMKVTAFCWPSISPDDEGKNPKRARSMRRKAAAVLMLVALGGVAFAQSGPETGGAYGPHWGKSNGPPIVPGVKGPYGENV